MSELFNKILYQPLFNVLVFLYQYLGDLGVAIIILTVLIRVVLFPLFYKGAKDQAIMQRLAPKIKEIQTNHKNNREEQAKALMGLYREHKVNPLSSFLLILVQLPILIALYQVFMKGLVGPDFLDLNFLGLIDLSKKSAIIVGLAAVAQYFQGKLSIISQKRKTFKDLTPMERMGRQMIYLGPILTIIFCIFSTCLRRSVFIG